MKKIIGDIYWVIQPDYPQVSGSYGSEQIVVEIIASLEGITNNLPSFGDYFASEDSFFATYSYLELTSRTIKCAKGIYKITLTYTCEDSSYNSEATVKSEVEYNTQDCDIPLEQHKNYRTYWNYNLLSLIDVSAIPSWYESCNDGVIPSSDAETYMWLKATEQVPSGYKILKALTKSGVEAYRSGITTVNEIKRSSNKSKLERDANADYTISSPSDTFDREGEWLRGGSQIKKNGSLWELSVSYLNSETVDKDLYS